MRLKPKDLGGPWALMSQTQRFGLFDYTRIYFSIPLINVQDSKD